MMLHCTLYGFFCPLEITERQIAVNIYNMVLFHLHEMRAFLHCLCHEFNALATIIGTICKLKCSIYHNIYTYSEDRQ